VEHAVVDDHLEVDALEPGRQFGAVDPLRVEFVDVVDLRPGEVLHRQRRIARRFGVGLGDAHVLVVPEVLPDLFEHRALSPVVHLLSDRLRELLGQVRQRERTRLVDEEDDHGQRPAQHRQVGVDQRDDSRATDLHGDRIALVDSPVHLPETRAADGVGVELVERRLDGPEFGLQHLLRLGPVGRRHLVLQARQHVDVLRRHYVGPGRQQLAEFDERRPERQQRVEQHLGAADSRLAIDAAAPPEQQESVAVPRPGKQQREEALDDDEEAPVGTKRRQPESPLLSRPWLGRRPGGGSADHQASSISIDSAGSADRFCIVTVSTPRLIDASASLPASGGSGISASRNRGRSSRT